MGEINNQVMHYKKVKNYFGWEPLTEFDYGLDVTIEWFAKYIKNIGSK
jgi:dTDP-D-glucose 4,6-dehydratase